MLQRQGPEDMRPRTAGEESRFGQVAGRKGRSRPAPPGKRLKEGDDRESEVSVAGSKKNRHAFGDVTNQENAPSGPQRPNQSGKSDIAGVVFGAQGLQELRNSGFTATSAHQPFLSDLTQGTGFLGPAPLVKEIDVQDEFETYTCATYARDIYANLFNAERLRRPSTTYMEAFQSDLTHQMRAILVDWMIEVAQEYELVSDTLFLAVSYLDRYLSVQQVPRSRLQLAGVACMLIAAKYEEIYAPQIDELCFIMENTYTRADVISTESDVLDRLAFECTTPTSKAFLRRFLRAAEEDVPDGRLHFLASYLTELALPEYSALQFLPSQVAAAAVMVASYTLAHIAWTPTLQHYTRCTPPELCAPARLLHSLFLRARTSPLPAARDKFSNPRYKCVASVPPPDSLPEWLFHEVGSTPASRAHSGASGSSVMTPGKGGEGARMTPDWSQGSVRPVGPPSGGLEAIKAYHGSRP